MLGKNTLRDEKDVMLAIIVERNPDVEQ